MLTSNRDRPSRYMAAAASASQSSRVRGWPGPGKSLRSTSSARSGRWRCGSARRILSIRARPIRSRRPSWSASPADEDSAPPVGGAAARPGHRAGRLHRASGQEQLRTGRGATTVYNAANEIAVAAFASRQIRFGAIARLVEATLEGWVRTGNLAPLVSADDAISVDHNARNLAKSLLPQIAAKAS